MRTTVFQFVAVALFAALTNAQTFTACNPMLKSVWNPLDVIVWNPGLTGIL